MPNPTTSHDELIAAILNLSRTALWVILIGTVVYVFRKALRELLQNLSWRLNAGASIKIWQVELGQVLVTAGGGPGGGKPPGLYGVADGTDSMLQHRRDEINETCRRVFLVHRVDVSKTPGQLYDALIYIIPAPNSALTAVQRVEYFFGRSWKSKIFTSIDRAKGFPVAASAYGPFLCLAKIVFTDGTEVVASRFIDFEMGGAAVATAPSQ